MKKTPRDAGTLLSPATGQIFRAFPGPAQRIRVMNHAKNSDLILRRPPQAGVSKDGQGAGLMVRDTAESIIGPRFARTRWRLLTMRNKSPHHERTPE